MESGATPAAWPFRDGGVDQGRVSGRQGAAPWPSRVSRGARGAPRRGDWRLWRPGGGCRGRGPGL